MARNIISLINRILIIAGSLFLGLLCVILYLGTKESYDELFQEPVKSFFSRFGPFAFIGFVGTIILVMFNFLFNISILRNREKINLKKLFIYSLAATLTTCFLGTLIFFRGFL